MDKSIFTEINITGQDGIMNIPVKTYFAGPPEILFILVSQYITEYVLRYCWDKLFQRFYMLGFRWIGGRRMSGPGEDHWNRRNLAKILSLSLMQLLGACFDNAPPLSALPVSLLRQVCVSRLHALSISRRNSVPTNLGTNEDGGTQVLSTPT